MLIIYELLQIPIKSVDKLLSALSDNQREAITKKILEVVHND